MRKPAARMEGEALLGTLARKVSRIEIEGEPVRHPNSTIRGLASTPMAFRGS